MPNASDIADWIEKYEEAFWETLDVWLLDSLQRNQVGFIGTTVANLVRTTPRTGSKVVSGTIADLLRFGTFNPDDTSTWGITKSVGANALRLISVVGPAGRALGYASRYVGLVAASRVKYIAGSDMPCVFASVNNVLSLLSGRTNQLFGSVDSIIAATGADAGWLNTAAAQSSVVTSAMNKAGIFAKRLFSVNTLEEIAKAARTADGPIVFDIRLPDLAHAKGIPGHIVTVMRGADNILHYMDYANVPSLRSGVKGYASVEELVRALGFNTSNIQLLAGETMQYSSQYLFLLRMIDNTFVFGTPFVLGIRANGSVVDMAKSIWRFITDKLPGESPPPPPLEFGEMPQTTVTIIQPGRPPYWYTVKTGIPKEDWPSSRAGAAYNDMLLWPLILEATQEEERKTGGVRWRDQNKLQAGQRIYVPDISGYSAQRVATAHTRGKDWQRVGP